MAPPSLSLSPIFGSSPSPYTTAPSSPKLLAYFSDDNSESDLLDSVCSFVPFNWEEKPGKPKITFPEGNDDDYGEVSFDFRVNRLDNALSLPAEELFAGGKIKPLKPPPRLLLGDGEISGRRSVSNSSRRTIVALSARYFIDPFEAAIESARRGDEFCEIEAADETASFAGSRRFKRLRNLLPFKKLLTEGGGRGNRDSKGGSGSGSGSGSSSSSAAGSVYEPDDGFEDGRRSLSPFRRQFLFCCLVEGM